MREGGKRRSASRREGGREEKRIGRIETDPGWTASYWEMTKSGVMPSFSIARM